MKDYVEIATSNPDFFMSIILIWVLMIIFVPMLWFFINNINKNFNNLIQSFKSHSDDDNKKIEALNNSIIELSKNIELQLNYWNEQFELLKDNIWRKSINKNDAIHLIKKCMLSWSYKKLDYLEKRLNKNNLQERKETIKRQIKLELIKLSDEEYLIFLDSFVINGKKLWDLIREYFSFDEFIEEVYDCIFDVHVTEISTKIKNVLEVMKVYQSECVEKIKDNI